MRNLEDLIRDTYGHGLAQVIVVGLATLPRITMGWSMITMSFVNFVPKWCCMPDNLTASSDLYCSEDDSFNETKFGKTCWLNTSSCKHRVFASGVRTLVNEWDLVCEKKWMVPLTTSVQMAGVLFGAMLAGQMADLAGRKKAIYLSTACCAVFNIVGGFSPVWEMFVAIRFFIGLTIGGYLAVAIPYTTEFVLPDRRAVVSIIPTFQIGIWLMVSVAWTTRDWRMVHWMCGAMTVPFLLGYFILPESLRWLTVQGRVEEAHKVVEWIARLNKQEVPKDSFDIIKSVKSDAIRTEKQIKYTYIHIYKGRRLFKTSVILQYIWCILSLCAYGLSFGASASGNVYLNIFLLSLAVLPVIATATLVIDRIGRKRTAILFFILSSACGFTSLAVRLAFPAWDKLVLSGVILNMFSRAFISCAWSAITITTNEIYPTVIRGLGYGASNVVSRIGGILAPFALNFEDNPTMSQAVVGITLLTAAFTVIFLDETSGKAMQDAIIEPPSATHSKTMELNVHPEKNHVVENVTSSYATINSSAGDSIVIGSGDSEHHLQIYVTLAVDNEKESNDCEKNSRELYGIDNTAFTEKL